MRAAGAAMEQGYIRKSFRRISDSGRWEILFFSTVLLLWFFTQARVYSYESILLANLIRNGGLNLIVMQPLALLITHGVAAGIGSLYGGFDTIRVLGFIGMWTMFPVLFLLRAIFYHRSADATRSILLTLFCASFFVFWKSATSPGLASFHLLALSLFTLRMLRHPPRTWKSVIFASSYSCVLVLSHIAAVIPALAALRLVVMRRRRDTIMARIFYSMLSLLPIPLVLFISGSHPDPGNLPELLSGETFFARMSHGEQGVASFLAAIHNPLWFERYFSAGLQPDAWAVIATGLVFLGAIAGAITLLMGGRAGRTAGESRSGETSFLITWMAGWLILVLAAGPAEPSLWFMFILPLLVYCSGMTKTRLTRSRILLASAALVLIFTGNGVTRFGHDARSANNELFRFCTIVDGLELGEEDLLLCDWVEVLPAMRYLYGTEPDIRSLRTPADHEGKRDVSVVEIDSLLQERMLRGVVYISERELECTLYPFSRFRWTREEWKAFYAPYRLTMYETRRFVRYGESERLFFIRRDRPR